MHDFGAAGDDDVGVAELQVVVRVHDRLGARRAGRYDGARVGTGAEVHADGGGGRVRHEHRDGHRHDPARALLLERVPGVEQGPEAADAGREVDADALGVDPVGEAGIRPRLARRDERELAGRVEPLGLRALEHLVGTHLRLGGEGHRELVLRDPVLGQRVRAGVAGQQGGPGLGRGAAERRGRADTGDDDLLGHSSSSAVEPRVSCVRRGSRAIYAWR